MIEKAKDFAMMKHSKQVDDSGKPYVYHLSGVARIISTITEDTDIISAAWLHDTIEDTDTTYEELVDNFGRRIAELVLEVTNEVDEKYGKYFPRLLSKEAIMIKFADRLHNISRMDCWEEDRIEHYLRKSRFWKRYPNEMMIDQKGNKKLGMDESIH